MGPLVEVLHDRGFTRIDLDVSGPLVPLSLGSDVAPTSRDGSSMHWNLRPGSPAPTVTVALHPDIRLWWFGLDLIVGAPASLGIALWCVTTGRDRSHRGLLGCTAAAGLLAPVVGLVTRTQLQADSLAVTGHLGGFPLLVTRWTSVLVLVLVPFPSLGFLVVALVSRPKRRPVWF
jgi:hypothetical protein